MKQTKFRIENSFYKELILENITFSNFNITNSTLFSISGDYLDSKI